ncbi:MFS transporter [Erwinia sp. OLTSP20]|uniref:DHA2 family efflux MFS transporter permease subunit n=1 Tax=unclassified Erwinia TaxID=2622719 RepID=UPI000C1A7A9F|nr:MULTISPECIES: DHA2 family efflux MFS transporter permease subunit [unclassified Erwinia]PIJ48324.1 MFS transporter [Erwinia sp. OAMSP11]PIJ72271.1 MFS transporter [Erwinia sp. OLSSP12]PIJ80022.1 MFS transporter [Erwinia sp. OLMTSP26]PIJ81630.1 MFS transporter [Erwinia sp. OLCASP19]PIJ84213.1 MFS transporter [Erwinia sp. OLMDSP33]
MIKSARSMAGLPWIAAMAFFMQSLDATILNTAIPAIARSLNHSPLAMQSAVISYTLTVALLIPISGWLADRYGTRRVFVIAVSLFSFGSLLCALSGSLTMLVISRVIQGIGGAMMMPVARLALLRAYPRSELLPVLNFVTMPGLVGPIMGPLLGGVLVTWATWHWIFLINIPIGLIGIFYAGRYMPNFTTPKRRFDLLGFLLFGLGLVLISSGLELFGEQIASYPVASAVLVSGGILLLLYIAHARRHPGPLIDLPMFRTRTFSVGIAGNIASRLGTGAIPFLMPLMLQVGFGYQAIIAGCMMAPTAIGSIIAKSTVTQLLRWHGYRKTLVGISIIIGILIASFALQSPQNSIIWLLIALFVLGMAMSTQFTAMNTITLADLTDDTASSGNSILAVTQQLAIGFGVAISAAVLRFYQNFNTTTVAQFHATFITMGVITVLASAVFLLLKKGDGRNLISDSEKKGKK